MNQYIVESDFCRNNNAVSLSFACKIFNLAALKHHQQIELLQNMTKKDEYDLKHFFHVKKIQFHDRTQIVVDGICLLSMPNVRCEYCISN